MKRKMKKIKFGNLERNGFPWLGLVSKSALKVLKIA